MYLYKFIEFLRKYQKHFIDLIYFELIPCDSATHINKNCQKYEILTIYTIQI